MTAVVNTDCESITLDSTYLSGTNQSVTLDVKINCTQEYTIDVSVSATDYTLLPATIEQEDVISDGVYQFVFTIIQSDGTKIEETLNKFVNCGSDCLMVETFKSALTNQDCLVKAMAYYALIVAEECTACTYEDMCALYNATGLTTNYNANDCGCS
jgi:hypothetical protein